MDLYFLRHAIAVDRGDEKYKEDSLRPLTEAGQAKMHSAALGMRALDLSFDLILSSPYLRAKQTAEIVAKVYQLNAKDILLTKNLLAPADIDKLLHEIRTLAPQAKAILLVGHEPHLSEMISCLLKTGNHLPINFKKGGLCSLSLGQPWGRGEVSLNWLLTPHQLRLMAPTR